MKGIKAIAYTLTAVAALTVLSGCSAINLAANTSYLYQSGEKYTAGDRDITEKIEAIDIDYMSGDVKLTGSSSGTVTVRETAKKELKDEQKVHTWVDGSTLRVRYCASARRLDLNNLGKQLEITLPGDVSLADLKVDVSSGNVNCSSLDAVNVNISASSGDIAVSCTAKTAALTASSGSITFGQSGTSDLITAKTSSGNISISAENAMKVELSASSGDITLNAGNINELKSETSSGINEFRLAKAPAVTDIESSSGDVTIYLPEESDLTCGFDTSSGKLYYESAFVKNGDTYVSGNGTNRMNIETSSGDIELRILK